MTRLPFIAAALAIACFSFSFSGCDQPKPTDNSAASTNDHGHSHDGESHEGHEDHEDHGHDHSSISAPHGGQIIDLGREGKYHAEMTDNHDTESITIYLLNGKMERTQVDTGSISLTLMSGDDAQTFDLTPQLQTGDGFLSFTISNQAAFEMLEAEGTEGKLRIEIDGTPFTGTFMHHDHDH